MDVQQQYSVEMLGKILSNQEVFKDMLQMLTLYMEQNEIDQSEIKNGIKDISTKVDIILDKINSLEKDINDIKSEERGIEEKITLITSKVSKIEKTISEEDLEDYYALSESQYSYWSEFDGLTRKFIPLSEYLYSKLQKYDKPDYSPVIIELCRAIENEFLIKLFTKYTLDVIKRYDTTSKLNDFLASDRSSQELKDKTGIFVKSINKASKTQKPEYTLGQMNMILSLTKDKAIVYMSPLLQDFIKYLEEHTESQNLLNNEYISSINEIVNEYRNPSAHPEFMSKKKAEKCKSIMPDKLDYLIECVV